VVVPCLQQMARTVTYDGVTGGLGSHLSRALTEIGLPSKALLSRLGDVEMAKSEFREAGRKAESIALIQTAAMVSVSECERHPSNAYETNVVRTMKTIEAFIDETERLGIDAVVVFTSSAHVYGSIQEPIRVHESTPTDPRSVYAKTKLRAENALSRLISERGARAVVARVFGLLGPNQRSHYLLPGLIDRVRSEEVTDIPGLDNVRDYLDAIDVAFHLGLLAERAAGLEPGQVDVVNVCSGEGITIRELLHRVLRAVFQDTAAYRRVSSRITSAPGRSTDLSWLVGDPTYLLEVTGLQTPRRIAIGKTIVDAVGE
jgi:nucleoside-diphosphate-sugar epimerase